MKIITSKEIESLGISPATCVQWVSDSFKMKYRSQCPAKLSVHPKGNDFITAMPALLPEEFGTYGVKVVSRMAGRHPALHSDIFLYDTMSGSPKAMLDADWITAMRTGAVAALTMKTLRRSGASHISMIGLGCISRTVMRCIAATFPDEKLQVKLMAYKDQAEKFVAEFADCSNLTFTIVDNNEDFLEDAEVVISCVTEAKKLLFEDDGLFGEGVLVIPVHTRGFQNCDLFFDKVFGDDTDHLKGFMYFSRFRKFDELGRVLLSEASGRESDEERILAYNVGLGLHDALFACRILDMMEKNDADS